MLPRLALAACAALTVLAGCGDDDRAADAPRPVALALDFQPNAVHAGIYTAIAEGIDRRHGIDVDVRVPSSSTDSLKLLAAGRADAAIVDIHDLGLAAGRGADVVGIGALVQAPLAAVIAQRQIRRPRDLASKRVGVTGLPSDDAVLRAVVESDGGDYDAIDRITIGFSAVPSLATRKVDAVVTFWNAEGVALDHENVPTRQFRVDRYGAPRYPELILTTTHENLGKNTDLYEDLVATLTAGTQAALADRPAAIEQIVAASDSDPTLVRDQLNAVAPALQTPLRLDPQVLQEWAAFDVRFGILATKPNVNTLFAPNVSR